MREPAPAQQLEFLSNIQRLLIEGEFTATYKYALLLAIADLCVEGSQDIEAMFILNVREIAEKFIEYYWPQAIPFLSSDPSRARVLFQNTNPGKEAKVLTILKEARTAADGSIVKARLDNQLWSQTLSNVARLIIKMPLWKLQTLGKQRICFIYENKFVEGRTGFIRLKPGVAHNFRRFYQLIHSLVKDAWVRYSKS